MRAFTCTFALVTALVIAACGGDDRGGGSAGTTSGETGAGGEGASTTGSGITGAGGSNHIVDECDEIAQCGDLGSGCVGCALEDICAAEYAACADDDECLAY